MATKRTERVLLAGQFNTHLQQMPDHVTAPYYMSAIFNIVLHD